MHPFANRLCVGRPHYLRLQQKPPGGVALARSGSGRTERVIIDAAKVLALLHTANEKSRLVPFSEFYNHELSSVRTYA